MARMSVDNEVEEENGFPNNGAEATELERAYSVRSLVRGLRILKCFDLDHPDWGLVELSKHTGLHKATSYRLVRTLEAEGFLAADAATGKYRLGPAMLHVAYLASSTGELVRVAHPYLEELASVSGETADLAIWEDGVLFIDEVLTSSPFKPAASVGRVFKEFGNSHGKILLAFGPDSRRVKFLARAEKARTQFSIVGPHKVSEELTKVASEGIAYDLQEQTMGICSVAAPVRDFSGEVIASLSVVAPEERFGPSEMRRHAKSVSEVADSLSRRLGWPEDGD